MNRSTVANRWNLELIEENYQRWSSDPTSVDATWQAFFQTAMEGRTPSQVASHVGLSVGAVYVAKSRVIARLRLEVERMRGDES